MKAILIALTLGVVLSACSVKTTERTVAPAPVAATTTTTVPTATTTVTTPAPAASTTIYTR